LGAVDQVMRTRMRLHHARAHCSTANGRAARTAVLMRADSSAQHMRPSWFGYRRAALSQPSHGRVAPAQHIHQARYQLT